MTLRVGISDFGFRNSHFGFEMTLSAETKLGPYEILSPLGAGGMGEVYRAKDTRLERTVAIKVLPQHLSSSPEVRQWVDCGQSWLVGLSVSGSSLRSCGACGFLWLCQI